MHREPVLGGEDGREGGVRVQPETVPDGGGQPLDVQVVGMLVGHEDVGDTGQVRVGE